MKEKVCFHVISRNWIQRDKETTFAMTQQSFLSNTILLTIW